MSDDSYEKKLSELCRVQPGDSELILAAREWVRSVRDLAPTKEAMQKLIKENIRLESSFVELGSLLQELLENKD